MPRRARRGRQRSQGGTRDVEQVRRCGPAACPRSSGGSGRSARSTSRWPRAACTRWSGPTGPARRPCSTSSPASSSPPPGPSRSSARTSPGCSPEQIARQGVARSFQITSLFENLNPREHVELALQSRTTPGPEVLALGEAAGPLHRPCGRAARPGRARRPRREAGRAARLRAEARPGDGHRAGARPEGAAARRADGGHGHRGRPPHHRAHPADRRRAAPWCSSTTTCTSSAASPTG